MKLCLQHVLIVENDPPILKRGLSLVQIVRKLSVFLIFLIVRILFYIQSGDQGLIIYQLQSVMSLCLRFLTG